MPDIWTHILFGEELLTEMLGARIFSIPVATEVATDPEIQVPEQFKGSIKATVQQNPELFRFACQGPDFFFFYRFWPWKKTHGIDDIGRRIQNDLGGEFIHTAIQYLKEQQPNGSLTGGGTYPQSVDNSGDNPVDSEEYQSLLTYVIGFIFHYALDASAHPFIHYKSGKYRKDDPESYQYYGNHKIFEELVDTILLEEKRGLKAAHQPVSEQIDLGESLPNSVLKFYQHQVDQLLDWHLDEQVFNLAYQDMLTGWRLFHDPLRYKYWFVRLIETASLGKLKYYQFFYPHTVNKSVDYLNRNQAQWCHPVDQDEVYTTSFDQLWDQAKEWARSWVATMFQYLQGELTDEELRHQIPNLSFSTGKKPDGRGEADLRYFDPVVRLK